MMETAVDPNLRRGRMTEETEWARRTRISARLKYTDEIADVDPRQVCTACQDIEGCAQRPNDLNGFFVGLSEFAKRGDRIIAFDGLSQIARRRQMVVHAAIENEEFLSTRNLDVIHSTYVHTRLSHQIAAGLDHELST